MLDPEWRSGDKMSEQKYIRWLSATVLFLVSLVLASCGGPPGEVAIVDGNAGLVRFYDYEAGVVCWSRINSYQSLACLPIEQTKLELPKAGD